MFQASHNLRLGASDTVFREACPACLGRSFIRYTEIEFNSERIPYVRCGTCSLIFMNPMPTQEWYDRLYANEFWEAKSQKMAMPETTVKTKQLSKELQRAEKLWHFLDTSNIPLPFGGRILEVGCAFGLIVKIIAERLGATALGVEPSRTARDFAQRVVGVDVVADTIDQLEDCESAQALDMLIFSHVMENIVDLERVFRTIRCIINPGGFILMDTLNIPFARGTHIYHPYCFSAVPLKQLYARHGLSIVRMICTGRPSSVLLPKYVTLLARIESGESVQRSKSTPGARTAGLRLALGRSMRGLIENTPLIWIDSMIASTHYRLRHAETSRLKSLLAVHCAETGRAAP